MRPSPTPDPHRRLGVSIWSAVFLLGVFVAGPYGAYLVHPRPLGPWWPAGVARLAGAILLAGSLLLFGHCTRLFLTVGRGTPSPISPARELVAAGIYRRSRNPIYLAQLGILCAWFLLTGSPALLAYAALWAAVVVYLVVRIEEPELTARFGAKYDAYRASTPRWFGRGR